MHAHASVTNNKTTQENLKFIAKKPNVNSRFMGMS